MIIAVLPEYSTYLNTSLYTINEDYTQYLDSQVLLNENKIPPLYYNFTPTLDYTHNYNELLNEDKITPLTYNIISKSAPNYLFSLDYNTLSQDTETVGKMATQTDTKSEIANQPLLDVEANSLANVGRSGSSSSVEGEGKITDAYLASTQK